MDCPPKNLPAYLSSKDLRCIVGMMTNSENSEKLLTEKLSNLRNPKMIRSFASDPELEDRLKRESESSGRSMSNVIRTALRKYFGV